MAPTGFRYPSQFDDRAMLSGPCWCTERSQPPWLFCPVIFGAVPLFLPLAAVGAIWIPARPAAALDPVTSLRHE
jgi:hypothetical protein